jgi:phage repressor protein C with HTH and peptisase S24 domain
MQEGLNGWMDTLGKRLKHARKERGLTQQQLEVASGVKQSDISKLERGESNTTTQLVKLARALGCSAEWLDTGNGAIWGGEASQAIDLDDNADFPAVRRVRFKLSAGATGFAVDYQDDDGAPIVFRRTWLIGKGLRADKLFAVSVANGSMEPGLYHGDTVVVNTDSTKPKDGVVFAVNYEGELVIKRLVRDAGQWWLSSDNPDARLYPRKLCDEHCIIIGEVVHKQSERI